MASNRGSDGQTGEPMIYQIRIKGHLGRQWEARFEELKITWEDDGTTLLSGTIIDQAALHGILRKIRDLGIPLLSVNAASNDSQDTAAPELK